MSNKLNALLALKDGIGNAEYTYQDVLNVLKGFHVSSAGNSFREHLVKAKDPVTGDDVMVDGFTLTQKMPVSTAKMLSLALKASSPSDFKFPVSIKFENSSGGYVDMCLTTKEDFAPYLMDDPRNIASINVHNMANYAIARSLVKSLAYANVYQFEPEMQYMPFPPDESVKPRTLSERVAHQSTKYIGSHKEVSKAVEEKFTARDMLDIKATFKSGLSYIKSHIPSNKVSDSIAQHRQHLLAQNLDQGVKNEDAPRLRVGR